MNKELMFSSANSEWETPPEVFEWVDREFEITIDSCATERNAKVPKYVSPEMDMFEYDFEGETAWMNPPYGRAIKLFVEKAWREGRKPGTRFVCLLPARTDTKWWHRYVMDAYEIYLVEGRIKFIDEEGKRQSSAPFPSAIVVFDEQAKSEGWSGPLFRTVKFRKR